ncbi:MAG: amino acid ABC transporter substrate-binding protein [Deltaproteobacteria bacterium RBG_19FT_COMBO_46_12]|nr:MAG: amino acid ABC transporter substrate-binding protein [Deltaproteobacteria bacterium RBG_19FT_COMBO_46_12]
MRRRKEMKKFTLLALFLITSLVLCISNANAQRTIKVGILDPYTGPAAVFANDALNSFKLELNEINKKGVLGTKIEFTTRDTKFKVDVGLSAAKELVMMEKVDLLVGTINSAVSLAVSDYAKAEKTPFIVWISKSEKITGEKGHRYVFSTAENTFMAGKAGGIALSKKPFVKYWIAGDDYEYGHAIADGIWRNLKIQKPTAELIGQSWWKVGEPDLVPYLTSILAAKPDAVIICGGGATMTNSLKACKATGFHEKVPVYMHTATDHTVLKPLGKEAPEGVMGTMDYHFYHPNTPANKAFVKTFQDAYGGPPGFPAFHAYITAHLIAKSFIKAGAIDKEKFINAMEGMKVDSPAGEVEMRACDHQAVLPMFLGVTKKVPQYDFLISSDIVTFTGKDIMPTCEEIKKVRGGS